MRVEYRYTKEMKKGISQLVKLGMIIIISLCSILLLFFYFVYSLRLQYTPLPCDTSVPKEITSLVYPGVEHGCWQGKIMRLKYYIGDYLEYPAGGSREGVSVEILFKKAMGNHPYISGNIGVYPYTRATHYPDINFYSDLKREDFNINIPGYKAYKITATKVYKAAYKGSTYTYPKQWYCYTLDSNEVVIEVCAVEHEIPLKTDPIKVLRYVTKAMSLHDWSK